MNRADRGPMLLVIAGILLLLAVTAYLINDAQDESRRRQAAARDRLAVRAHVQQATAELKALQQERDRNDRQRAQLDDQNRAVLESLKRIERRLGEAHVSKRDP